MVTTTYRELKAIAGFSDEGNCESGIVWEIPRTTVKIEKNIGKGAFGQVAQARLFHGFGRSLEGSLAAVKMVKGMIILIQVHEFLR